MYAILVEAGGLHQMARIHPSWQRRFLLDLGELLGRYDFIPLRHDGDQLLFLQENPSRVSSLEETREIMGELLLGLRSFLADCAENLLDYTVLLAADLRDRSGAAEAFPGFLQQLSAAREENALYLTGEAAEYFRDALELVREGALFRVASLVRADQARPGPYSQALRCSQQRDATLCRPGHRGPARANRSQPDQSQPDQSQPDQSQPDQSQADQSQPDREIGSILQVLSGDESSGGFWFCGSDRSALAAWIEAALEVAGSSPAVVIQCSRAATRRDFLRMVIQAIPDTPVPASERSEEDRVYGALREQLREPGRGYLARTMIDHDLRATAAFLVRRFFLSDSRRRVYLADGDLCQGGAREFLSWIPEVAAGAPLVVSAAAPPGEGPGPWVVTDLSSPTDSSSRTDRSSQGDIAPSSSLLSSAEEARYRGEFGRALRYWETSFGSGRGLAGILRQGLNPLHRRVLFLVYLLRGRGGITLLDELCRSAGIPVAEESHALRELLYFGLLPSLTPPRVHEAVACVAGELLSPRERSELEQQVSHHLAGAVMAGTRALVPEMWDLVRTGLSREEQASLLHPLLQRCAEGGGKEELEELAREIPRDILRETRGSLESAQLRLVLRWAEGPEESPSPVERLSPLADRLSSGEVRAPAPWESDLLLALGEYQMACRDYAGAQKLCKKAVLLNQERPEQHSQAGRSCRGMAHLLMARIALYQGQLRESGQYISFAQDEGARDTLVWCEARVLEGIHCFLLGNYTRADRTFGEIQPRLFEAGASHLLVLSWFARARLRFELGEYSEARAGFAFLERYSGERELAPVRETARAWKRRALCFLHDRSGERVSSPEAASGKSDPQIEEIFSRDEGEFSPEETFFLAEALCRRGCFARALPLLDQVCQIEGGSDRWPHLGVAWDNGFAPLEDLLVGEAPGTSELGRLATACRAWALARTGRMDEAVPLFFGLTRSGNGVSRDPQALVFTYLYATVLPEKRSPDQDDRATILGRAVKICQERSSRIEDHQDRVRFTRNNLWTRELLEAARRYNLV
ncbi:hypothetical protein AU468_11825 [Alkalispirochaeta sphaeroplastigenens]|uniref:MalT-like TPR region domain-containing protein n=1 Tax=Alkalispirochaeta sphaeroplastigenens TaxID=1187066 RepID=A0A2S4JGN6_9SPIO|nr:hypothetical protein [Alkalispirochaeta sphaeroplastigenens]POQ98724.1 hypothetical protein AU468_11825 [Alkalispirochaeta sphaeroplastigenens]